MEIAILAVGKLRSFYREACDEYLRRLRRDVTVQECEVRESRAAGSGSAALADEAERMLARAPGRATLVALTRRGEAWDSLELARRLQRWRVAARPVTFAIGGSHGLAPGLLRASSAQWSLGPLTFPHELARVIVCEQLYRGFSILRGEPYHKGGR